MKLTDFLQDIGRPIAYYPKLRKLTGSTNATILLCQFIYWRGKESDPNGWLYKTAEDIEEETGLSYNEQKTARAALKDARLIDEHYARLDHQMRFKVNLDAVNEKWGTLQSDFPEHDKVTLGSATSQRSLNESENTTENTSKEVVSELPKTDETRGKYITGIEAAIWQGRPVTEADLPDSTESQALQAFERDMQLPASWEWYPAKSSDEKAWRELREFVIATYGRDQKAFERYHTWRNQPYVRGAMSNLAIRQNPANFETSFSDFLQSEKKDAPERPSQRIGA